MHNEYDWIGIISMSPIHIYIFTNLKKEEITKRF